MIGRLGDFIHTSDMVGNEYFLAWEAIVYFSSLKHVNSLRRLVHLAEGCTEGCAENSEGFYK